MKKIVSLFAIFAASLNLSAQTAKHEPLIIQGKITNSQEKMLKIFFLDEKEKTILDTIHLKEDGSFYLKTNKITRPQRTSLQQNRTQLNQIYVAPGYNLTIIGDARDHKTLLSGKKISGKGAEVNAYRTKLDSAYAARPIGQGWFEMNLDDLLKYIANERKLQDSIHHIVFAKNTSGDKYFETFKKMIQVDNESVALYNLLVHMATNKYDYEKMTSLFNAQLSPAFKNGISNDSYLNAEDYKTWLLDNYISYRRQLDKLKDSTQIKQPDYGLKSIQEALNGKVRNYYLSEAVTSGINGSKTIEELNNSRKKLTPCIENIKDDSYKAELSKVFTQKEKQLLQVQVGKPAPDFTLLSDDGKTYRLADFKGKVLYIDLWASWCAPCREAMPDFKKLYNKYKTNQSIAFLGIAVWDGNKEWRQAIKEEKPTWTQLRDEAGVISKSYMANAIPKYIIIDKKGNIVSFDAPGPRNSDAEKLLQQEMEKE